MNLHVAPRVCWLFLLSVFIVPSISQAQLVDGIIRDEILNQYRSVTVVGSCWVEVTAIDSLVIPGDRVVLMQMQGATVSLTSDTLFGQVVDVKSAGNFEFATVDRVVNNRIYFTRSLSRTYEADGVVQLIKVRHYRNATVTGIAVVQPFNGAVGGVAVVEVQDTLFFVSGAGIDVSTSGFRGGRANEYNIGCGGTSGYFYGQPEGESGGNKGEGIAAIPPTHIGGRGAFANGGGGGNNHNGGGGGGGNAGSGGFGGCEWSGCSQKNLQTRGIGGYPVYQLGAEPIRVFMGGGGGAGHTNNGTGTSGGNGGGIIIIRAKHMVGGILTSRGGDVPVTIGQGQDGSGGGGAGGTIVLDVGSIAGTVSVNANGSNGGSTTFYQYVGPGGGGSGGVIWCRDAALAASPSLQTSSKGGVSGIHINNGNEAWEATNGSVGIVASGFTIDEGKENSGKIVDGPRPINICSGGSAVVASLSGFSDHQWSTGQTSPAITVKQSGIYHLSAISPEGCRVHDSVEVIYNTALVANAGADVILCQGGSTGLMASAQHGIPPFSYEWSPSVGLSSATAQNPIASPTTQTRYQVIITDANGCRDTAWVTVTPVPSPLQILYSSANGTWDWNTVGFNTLRCDSIILRNTTTDTLTITASLLANVEFSMPPAQFPLRIPPRSQQSLKVCLRSGALGQQQDTLLYSALCSGQIPLLVRTQFDATGVDICGDSLRLRPASANAGLLRILPPIPNPALHETVITVERATANGNAPNPGLCVLYNAAGVAVLQTAPAEVDSWEASSTVVRQFHYRLALGQLPAGLYQILFPSIGGSSLPMVVVR